MKKNNVTLVFAKRNIKEIWRSPISWGFGLGLPIALFVIMQIIIKSIGEGAEHVPMFAVGRFSCGIVVFGAGFLSLFTALLISGDRSTSFLTRLLSSPMKSVEYVVGYLLGVLPIAGVQMLITFIAALCFGLTPTPHIIVAMLFGLLLCVMFIALGALIGTLVSAKGAPPVCSAVVQVTALLSGMWFDLDTIGGGFDIFCHVLPFAHGYDMLRFTIEADYSKVWLPVLVVALYTAALCVAAVIAFKRSTSKAF